MGGTASLPSNLNPAAKNCLNLQGFVLGGGGPVFGPSREMANTLPRCTVHPWVFVMLSLWTAHPLRYTLTWPLMAWPVPTKVGCGPPAWLPSNS